MTSRDAVAALRALGFSEIESLVYCFLLGESPATGYRISKSIGKAAANTYAAIESLAQKGALLVDDGETRLCRAVAPDELCEALRARCDSDIASASLALAAIAANRPDERVYRLETAGQVFARAAAMIDGAASHLLIDAFPDLLARVSEGVVRALRRGVVVAIDAYDEPPPGLDTAIIVRSPTNWRPRGHGRASSSISSPTRASICSLCSTAAARPCCRLCGAIQPISLACNTA